MDSRLRADDGTRTRDPHLGKVMLYQLSHIRVNRMCGRAKARRSCYQDDRGRYWDRTSDLFRVREARYRCANRAHKTVVLLRGEDGIRTRVHGFAGRCLTTRPPHRIRSTRERVRTLGVLTSG